MRNFALHCRKFWAHYNIITWILLIIQGVCFVVSLNTVAVTGSPDGCRFSMPKKKTTLISQKIKESLCCDNGRSRTEIKQFNFQGPALPKLPVVW